MTNKPEGMPVTVTHPDLPTMAEVSPFWHLFCTVLFVEFLVLLARTTEIGVEALLSRLVNVIKEVHI
jgi:hypothetical protein